MSLFTNPPPSDNAEENRRQEAESTVLQYTLLSLGASIMPCPMSDAILLTGIQTKMLYDLAQLYKLPFNGQAAKVILASIASSTLSVSLNHGVIQTLKNWLIGTTCGEKLDNADFSPLIGCAATYAVGKVFIYHFEAGGNLTNFNFKRARTTFDAEMQAGKNYAATQLHLPFKPA